MDVDRIVDQFLTSNSRLGRAGGKCRTCQRPNREEIDRACRRYFAAKREGKTMIPFATFVASCLRDQFGYDSKPEALLRHVRGCLGEDA